MCRYYPRLHARQINRALAELGLQLHSILGWELTRLGRSLGGLQEESSTSGSFYVTWPHEIIDNPVVHRELRLQSDQIQAPPIINETEADLFATSHAMVDVCRGVDGHNLGSPLQTSVCNWLYMAQLAHAFQRALPTEELVYADFYVPLGNIYIDCWEASFLPRSFLENSASGNCIKSWTYATWKSIPAMAINWTRYSVAVCSPLAYAVNSSATCFTAM